MLKGRKGERSFILPVGVFPRRKNLPTEVSEYKSLISLVKSLTGRQNLSYGLV